MLPQAYTWKKAPFIRVLAPFMAGILWQWYGQCERNIWYITLATGTAAMVAFSCLSLSKKFRYRVVGGIIIMLPFIALGALSVWYHDLRHSAGIPGPQLTTGVTLFATLAEAPAEKTNSLKATAVITGIIDNGNHIAADRKIIIYFRKDSLPVMLQYGSVLVFKKPLQEIQNAGNPAGFDYKRYALFQGITHQVFLARGDYALLPYAGKKWLGNILEKIRQAVLSVLRAYIPGDDEAGLAEALLIGYKNDLDKTLVQSYTNTGVVHIIAISGLHLGLIYWLLVGLLRPLQNTGNARWLRPLIIIAGLWLFSLLAGAQPSILRSAVMFTCIVLGENTGRKSSIYNTLSFSAFLLLCYNPFWLWDLGFQLSYSAVLSIVIFMHPVYNLLYIKNKLLDMLWKMNAVTMAAQVLTVPVSIYHFHQFPNLFLFTNLVAVPLSSAILLGEIFLCMVFFFPWLASLLGHLLSWLISLMNGYIVRIENISFSLWQGLQVTLVQAILMYMLIAGMGYWLLEKSKKGFATAIISTLAFFMLRSYSFCQSATQRKIIIYNIPRFQAIDLVDGRRFLFRGDSSLPGDDFAKNFHLKPSRTLHRLMAADTIAGLWRRKKFTWFYDKLILFADTALDYQPGITPVKLDLLIISKKPKLDIARLAKVFEIKQVVFDSSVHPGTLKNWKKDCEALGLVYHDVSEKGAFVMRLN